MEAVAKLSNCSMSARKMRLVIDLVRGREVNDALNVLKFTKKEAARWVEKLLISAISNWENKAGSDAEDYGLYIKEAYSNEGPTLKRFRPAPHGRAHRIRKRTNHVTLVLDNKISLEDSVIEEVEAEEVV